MANGLIGGSLGSFLSGAGQVLGAAGDPQGFFKRQQEQQLAEQIAEQRQQALAQLQASIANQAVGGSPQQQLRGATQSALAAFDPKAGALSALAMPKTISPSSAVGKIQSDINRGIISEEQGGKAIRKALAPATSLIQQASGERAASTFAAKAVREDPLIGLVPLGETAVSAKSSLRSFQAIDKLLDELDESDLGAFSEFKLKIKKSINAIGFDFDVTDIKNLETLISRTNKLIGANIGDLGAGTGLSDKDAELTRDAIVNLGQTKAGAKQVATVGMKLDQLKINRAKFRTSLQSKRTNFKGIDGSIEFEVFVREKMTEFDDQTSVDYNAFLSNLIGGDNGDGSDSGVAVFNPETGGFN